MKVGVIAASSAFVLSAVVWSCGGDTSTTGDAGGDASQAKDVGAADVSAQDSSTNDGGDGAVGPACTPSKPFGALALVAELGAADAGNGNARLSNDGLTVYYSTAGDVILTATRATATSAFGPSSGLLTVADASVIGEYPSVSPDALTIYAQYNPSNFVELVYGTRATATSNLDYFTPIPNVSGAPPNHGSPFLQGDNSTLWYGARVSPDGGPTQGGTSLDIFSGQVVDAGQLANLAPQSELSTALDETNPTITPDGLVIFFGRKADTDGGASATYHVYTATRANKSDPFATPVIVPELDDVPTSNTQPSWISPDNCSIWIDSDRSGSRAIYVAKRSL